MDQTEWQEVDCCIKTSMIYLDLFPLVRWQMWYINTVYQAAKKMTNHTECNVYLQIFYKHI
jgi:hypothetical protein